jgi:putative hydrolase of the HAD superfamily
MRAVPVRGVVFDWGGTLTPWHAIDLFAQWRAYADAYDPARADELASVLHAEEERLWQLGRDSQRSGTLDEVFRRAGVEPSGERHERALSAYHRSWQPHTLTDPDALPLLDALRARGIRVGVLSNTLWTREFHEEVFRRDGLLGHLDGAVYSSEIAYTKPHPEAFRAAIAAIGIEDPAACVMVGDRPFDDIHGARQVGMRTVLVPHSSIPADQHGHTLGEPDAVVQRLADLLPLVDAWAAA